MIVELLLMVSLGSSEHGHHEGHQRDGDGSGRSAAVGEKGSRISLRDNDEAPPVTVVQPRNQKEPIAGQPPPKVALPKTESEALSSKHDSRHAASDAARSMAQSVPVISTGRGANDGACTDAKVDPEGGVLGLRGDPCEDLGGNRSQHRL